MPTNNSEKFMHMNRQYTRTPRMAGTLVSFLVSFALAITMFATVGDPQQTDSDKYAPLPDQIVRAKTVFLINETGKAKFGDAVYKQIKAWNRWQVITDKAQWTSF